MKHIHPFPARMAPEIVLEQIGCLDEGLTVLDPMSGSGMVLGQAARQGLNSIGYEIDPLARLISRVGSTKVNEKHVEESLQKLLDVSIAIHSRRKRINLPWIDEDEKTSAFVSYWFDKKQEKQLRSLVFHLLEEPVSTNQKVLNVLKVALSRLIITKEPKASLARDTAHSRPHKVIESNNFDIFAELPTSLNHVLKALDSTKISINSKTYLGDARRMTRIHDECIDAIITSPPYLNAIDYMRGHRLSLVWLGYSIPYLRKIRASLIGAEIPMTSASDKHFSQLAKRLELNDLNPRMFKILERYFYDLVIQTQEAFRVLKHGASATYIIGNSTISGCHIKNNELLKKAARLAGFSQNGESERNIPNGRRYLPILPKSGNSLASRMRTEHIIEFVKP